jgi:hypothetical protein
MKAAAMIEKRILILGVLIWVVFGETWVIVSAEER